MFERILREIFGGLGGARPKEQLSGGSTVPGGGLRSLIACSYKGEVVKQSEIK